MKRYAGLAIAGVAAAVLVVSAWAARDGDEALRAPEFGAAFAGHWRDGHAELAGYALKYPRYGAVREGTAVTIFVTEPFSDRLRVKADPGHDGPSYEVVKLNLVQDFPTGVYDYNMMTSVFVPTSGQRGRPAGAASKVSFSSQEWCGHVYHHALFDADKVRSVSHSYFDGEADAQRELDYPASGIAEEALWHWARGLAAPVVAPGESREVRVMRSLAYARLRHVPVAWERATLRVAEATQTITAPAGEFEVREHVAAIGSGRHERTWTFHVETAAPHRIIRWARSDGVEAELLSSERLKYWQQNGPGDERLLERLGLRPRGPRTP